MDIYFGKYIGAQQYGHEDLKYKEKPTFNEPQSIVLKPLEEPWPETKFKQGSKPKVVFTQVAPCVSADPAKHLSECFVLSRERGYKKAGFKEGHLLGEPATNVYGSGSLGPVMAAKVDVPEVYGVHVDEYEYWPEYKNPGTGEKHGQAMGINGLDYTTVNEESARFQYGYAHYPPNMGKNIPGSDSVLLRDRNASIRPHKREGRYLSGRYAGWQSEDTSVNGMVDPYKT